MTLLNPWGGLLAAVLAGAAVTALYLLKLRRRPVRVGSTLLWRQAVRDVEVNVPWRPLRATPMLALHLLCAALLSLAIARPVLRDNAPTAPRLFLVVDRSASMSAGDVRAGGSRLESAKARALDRVRSLARRPRPPEVAVIAFAAQAELLCPPTRRLRDAEDAIRALTPTDQPGNPRAAAELLRALTPPPPATDDIDPDDITPDNTDPDNANPNNADGSTAPAPPPSIAAEVFTDLSPEETAAALGDTAGWGSAAVRITPVARGAWRRPGAWNAGIAAFSVERDIEQPDRVRIFLRVVNTAPDERVLPVVALVDGTPVRREALRVAAQDAGMPGEAVRTLEITLPRGGVVSALLDMDDALAADNTAAALLPAPSPPRVLVVGPEAEAADAGVDPFLLDVLRALPLGGLDVVPAAAWAGPADTRGADLLIADRVTAAAFPRVASLWLGAGPTVAVRAPASADAAPGVGPVVWWDRRHPLLDGLSLDAVLAARSVWFADNPTGVELHDVARDAAGGLIVEARTVGARHAVVGFALGDSNWPLDVSFPLFVAHAVESLSGAGEARTGGWFTTAEPVELAALAVEANAALVGPVERRLRGEAGDGANGGGADRTARFGVLERAGVYQAQGVTGVTAVAVNLVDAGESTRGGWEETGAAFGDGSGRALPESPARAEGGAAGEAGGVELWPWAALAAAGAMTLEWVCFAWLARVAVPQARAPRERAGMDR